MIFSDEQISRIHRIRDNMRITKVVATRAVKTKNGDFFVGWSAAWDTIQEDAGGLGADLIGAQDEAEEALSTQRGMTLADAKIADLILGMQVDLQALNHALAGSGISEEDHKRASAAVKRNYGQLLANALANGSD